MFQVKFICGLDKAPYRGEKTEIVDSKRAQELKVLFYGANRESAWQHWVNANYPSCNYRKGSGVISIKS